MEILREEVSDRVNLLKKLQTDRHRSKRLGHIDHKPLIETKTIEI